MNDAPQDLLELQAIMSPHYDGWWGLFVLFCDVHFGGVMWV